LNKKRSSKDTNAEDLFKLLDKFGNEYNPSPENPKLDEIPLQEIPEDNIIIDINTDDIAPPSDKNKTPWGVHFSDREAEGERDLPKRPEIYAHFSDEVPQEVAGFSSETLPETEDISPPEDEPEQTRLPFLLGGKMPLPIRAVVAAAKFFWNLGFIVKAAIYVFIVLLISAFMSYYVISVGNDVFAFVKSDKTCTVSIEEGMTRKEIAYLLEKNGLIEYSWAFNLFMIYRGDEDGAFLTGEHTLNASMNYSQIASALTEKTYQMIQVSVTIPEGYTTDQIIDLLVANGIGTKEGFKDAINNYPYKHEFVKLLEQMGYPAERKYRLEGYLYPDTYFFYKDSDEYLVINKMLNNFNDKFWRYYKTDFKEDIAKSGMTFDDIITLASMIQSEAKLFIDYEYISYVFHNRLNHPAEFPKLESDATIQYFLTEHTRDLTYEQLHTDNPYNTYIYEGLPPGAISNPGFDALSAAIYPDKPVDESGNSINAYFFVSNRVGRTYYAQTPAGHAANKARAARENEEYDAS